MDSDMSGRHDTLSRRASMESYTLSHANTHRIALPHCVKLVRVKLNGRLVRTCLCREQVVRQHTMIEQQADEDTVPDTVSTRERGQQR